VAQQAVAAVSSNAQGSVEIQLSPEELGRITLTLQVIDDAVVLAIQAERSETLDLMRRHADILQREFRDAGFTSLSFSFGQGSADGRPSRGPAGTSTVLDKNAAASLALQPQGDVRHAPGSSRVDLRL
jgi:hypothetical protein